jgi:heat-inducible transcriptional repressor
MNQRQATILELLLKEYVSTAQAISSNYIVEKYHLEFSSATVRNELMELEAEGYIAQPHTSAGRIPTEKAYRWLIDNLEPKKLNAKMTDKLGCFQDCQEANLKVVAKSLAEQSNLAVFWAFHRHNVYYTGISNLLHQAEFDHTNLIYDISAIIDRVDEIINDSFDKFQFGPQTLLGSDSPFGPFTASILSKYQTADYKGAFGIIGPLRQNYELNWQLINYLYEKICDQK